MTPANTSLPTRVAVQNLVTLGQKMRALINRDLPERIDHSLPAFQGHSVISTDTDRSTTYDFLPVIHTHHGSISTVSKVNGDFSRKSHNFPHRVFNAPAEWGPALNFVTW